MTDAIGWTVVYGLIGAWVLSPWWVPRLRRYRAEADR